MSKKYEVIMSTSSGHKIIIDAKDKDDAWNIAKGMSQDDIKEKAKETWDVDTFPMIVDLEETNA